MSSIKVKTNKISYQNPLYKPKNVPMNIIVFASGGGGNLQAAIDLSLKKPRLIKVGLVVTDRLGIRAIEIAKKYNIPVIAGDFEKDCGKWIEIKNDPKSVTQYKKNGILWHNNILKKILEIEKTTHTSFDLIVLSYHRWIHGDLLKHFKGKIINQHAGDLTVIHNENLKRKYIGINPVYMALKNGETKTRTSTFLVRKKHDGGEILCQGPWVKYKGKFPITKKSALNHELKQKKYSDWPSLTFALENIAIGNFGILKNRIHKDGCKVITFKNSALSYGGVDIAKKLL